MRSTKRNQAGFTLVELLVVIGILGVLSGVTVVGVDVVRTKAEQSACKADAQNLDTAEAAAITEGGAYLDEAGLRRCRSPSRRVGAPRCGADRGRLRARARG